MGDDPMSVAALGHSFVVSGQKKQGLEVLSQLLERAKKGYISAYDLAVIYAGLGDRDQMFKWLDRASMNRAPYLVYIGWDPRFNSLHSDSRLNGC